MRLWVYVCVYRCIGVCVHFSFYWRLALVVGPCARVWGQKRVREEYDNSVVQMNVDDEPSPEQGERHFEARFLGSSQRGPWVGIAQASLHTGVLE